MAALVGSLARPGRGATPSADTPRRELLPHQGWAPPPAAEACAGPDTVPVQRARSKAKAASGRKGARGKGKLGGVTKGTTPRRKKQTSAAAQLSANEVTLTGKECGRFKALREWVVTNPKPGMIVQEVTRTFAVERYDGAGWVAMTAADVDAYTSPHNLVYAVAESRYWEAWRVAGTGKVFDRGHDLFGQYPIVPANKNGTNDYSDTTRGTYTIRGEAKFYPGMKFPDWRTWGLRERGSTAPATSTA